MELKLHLYSITWVTSILKPKGPGCEIWDLEHGTRTLAPGTWNVDAKAQGNWTNCPKRPKNVLETLLDHLGRFDTKAHGPWNSTGTWDL